MISPRRWRSPDSPTYGLSDADTAEVVAAAQRASSMRGNPIELTDDEVAEILHGLVVTRAHQAVDAQSWNTAYERSGRQRSIAAGTSRSLATPSARRSTRSPTGTASGSPNRRIRR